MDPEKKYLKGLEQEDQQARLKKAILVVGRMGHGKSSFLRMLMQERNDEEPFSKSQLEKDIPLIQAGGKNGTSQCHYYKIHESHKLLDNEEVYAIDTPGLDCDYSACLITQQIDDLILFFKFEVIGIAYIIDINQREQGRNKSSYIGQFMNLMKIKKQYKINLLFCVCTKWDGIYDAEETLPILLAGFQQILRSNQCEEAYKKLVQWVNKPLLDFRKYAKFLKDEEGTGKRIVNNQWHQLKKIIQSQADKSCPYSQYFEDYQKYWQKLLQEIMKKYKEQSKQVSFKEVQSIFPVLIKKQIKKVRPKNILIPVFTSGTINACRFSLAFVLTPLALSNPIGISIMVVSGVVGLGFTLNQIRKQLKKKTVVEFLKQEKADDQKQQMMRDLELVIHGKILNYLCDELLNKLQKGDQSITIPDLYWLSSKIKAFYGTQLRKQSKPFATASKNSPKIKYNLIQGIDEVKILLQTKVWLPTIKGLQPILKQEIRKVYG